MPAGGGDLPADPPTAVDGVAVLHQPDAAELAATLGTLAPQLRTLHVVDNSPTGAAGPLVRAAAPAARYVRPGGNLGIAAAQNLGIAAALAEGADWVLLSDQDTRYPQDHVAQMLAAVAGQDRVGAVGPEFRDANTGLRQGFVRLQGLRARRLRPASGLHEVSQIIASGALLSRGALQAVGTMDADLFIDWVDIEWCWRARAAGWRVLGNADAVVDHRLGDRAARIAGKSYPLRGPGRSYYIVRNALHLALRHPAPTRAMRAGIAARTLRYALGVTALTRDMRHMGAALAGARDAIRHQLGPNSAI